MTQSVKVVTDSACDLPRDLVEKLSITVVPLSIRFGDDEFTDGVDLTLDEFWDKTNASNELPSTAAPSPGAFAAAFESALEEGFTSVVCVNLASGLSATYQGAVAGAELVKGRVDVRVIDSETCTVGQGSMVIEAATAAQAGADVDAVVATVESLRGRTRMFGTLDTLDNLRKGGRVGAAGAFFASLLSVKPVISIEGGEVKPKARQRTRGKALEHLAGLVAEHAPVSHVAVAHSGAPDVAKFIELLAPVADAGSILVTDIGPTIGVHGGPRLIAVSFASEK